jgi:hypothetical protein
MNEKTEHATSTSISSHHEETPLHWYHHIEALKFSQAEAVKTTSHDREPRPEKQQLDDSRSGGDALRDCGLSCLCSARSILVRGSL